jgi:L,D-peptidoglycan transpeptidase YkuD (ErfK/YbiS/YcfS/YnhG family)
VVGRSGTRPLLERRSGDGTTPAGVFPLGSTTAWDGQTFQFFGNSGDPGVRGAYRRVQPRDCWGATPGDPAYGHLVDHRDCPGPDDEDLSRIGDVYVHAAVIGANSEPDVSGDAPGETPYAAAIFLHRHNFVDAATDAGPVKPTSGCVSLAIDDLIATLLLIDPAERPYFAIGPADSWT